MNNLFYVYELLQNSATMAADPTLVLSAMILGYITACSKIKLTVSFKSGKLDFNLVMTWRNPNDR